MPISSGSLLLCGNAEDRVAFILHPLILLKITSGSISLCGHSRESPALTITPSANGDNFISSFPIRMFCLRTTIPVLSPFLGEHFQAFAVKRDVGCVLFGDTLSQAEKVSVWSLSAELLCHGSVLRFVKSLFCSY